MRSIILLNISFVGWLLGIMCTHSLQTTGQYLVRWWLWTRWMYGSSDTVAIFVSSRLIFEHAVLLLFDFSIPFLILSKSFSTRCALRVYSYTTEPGELSHKYRQNYLSCQRALCPLTKNCVPQIPMQYRRRIRICVGWIWQWQCTILTFTWNHFSSVVRLIPSRHRPSTVRSGRKEWNNK